MHLFQVVRIALISNNFLLTFLIRIGVIGAQKGTLTFMVGGESDDFHSVQPILANMGINVIHVGRNGSGLAAKISNNLLAAIRYSST